MHLPFFSHPITSPYKKHTLKGAFTSLLQRHSSHPTQLKQIHALLLTTGIHVKNSLLTKLLESFTLLGNMVYAHQLFDEMHKPRSYLWTTLVKGYVKNECFTNSILLYVEMCRVGVCRDRFTFPFVVKACKEMESVGVGEEVHGHLVKFGVEFDVIVRTELMSLYMKFGSLKSAEYLFDTMVDKDLVSWNALISGYQQNGYADKALGLFYRMEICNVKPDLVTLVSVLAACAHLGCLDVGREIHLDIVKEGIESNIIVDNALLDLYAKCGAMEEARCLFDEMPKRNVISWSTMIGGYAMNSESEKALCLFSRMQAEKVKPNHVTYLALLSACSHEGLIQEGKRFFKYMVSSNSDSIRPKLQHYTCMVDLLGRSGRLEEAYNFIKNMPIEPDSGVWGALLNACTIHQSAELGQHVADILLQLAPDIGSYSVLLSNIYAAAGRWQDVEFVRRRMRRKCVHREAGYSSVESNGEICVFFYGANQSHLLSADIYAVLEDLNKKVGDRLC